MDKISIDWRKNMTNTFVEILQSDTSMEGKHNFYANVLETHLATGLHRLFRAGEMIMSSLVSAHLGSPPGPCCTRPAPTCCWCRLCMHVLFLQCAVDSAVCLSPPPPPRVSAPLSCVSLCGLFVSSFPSTPPTCFCSSELYRCVACLCPPFPPAAVPCFPFL